MNKKWADLTTSAHGVFVFNNPHLDDAKYIEQAAI